jgi:putative peptidase
MRRVEKVRNLLEIENLDAIIVTNKITKQYIGAVTGSGNIVVITKNELLQFMDGRYQNEKCNLEDCDNIVLPNRDYFTPIIQFLDEKGLNKIGLEENGISISKYLMLSNHFRVKSVGDKIVELRSIKDIDEIEKIKLACSITDEILEKVLPQIRVGMSEKELVGLLYNESFKAGADCMSFEPIIASGWRGSLPHGRPTNKIIESGELVTIDFGIVIDNYQSDMTRTVGMKNISQELREIYETVRKAQQAAVDLVAPGVEAYRVDSIARNIITNAGYGEYFTHGLGHGIGIGGDIPMMNSDNKNKLCSNMVLTCEPGIYIPNLGGVRIEDVVLVTQDGGEALTKSDKSLILVG